MMPIRTQDLPALSVVIIGRNEGERLLRCIASVRAAHWRGLAHELIYVDSRSTDGSLQQARASGALALELQDPAPCAAKARNLGLTQARGEFILFLDGDTELDPDFVARALPVLDDPRLCAVWGHRRESAPQQSVLTRVLDLDWIYPVGRTLYFGGDVLVRRQALLDLGGFDPTLKAGEEPELCARLRARGWEIEHIDAPMTRHDLAVRTWRAYALRAYRSGIAYAEVADRMRRIGDPLWQHEAARDRRHALALLALPPALTALAMLSRSPGLTGSALAGVALLGLLLLARTVWRCRWKAPRSPGLLALYALHAHGQKIPALFGQWQWWRARRRQVQIGLVDYKSPDASIGGGPRRLLKRALVALLVPLAGLWRHMVQERLQRVWSLARLQQATGVAIDASNVLMGTVDLQGTGSVRLGRNALVYPGVCLETQGEGCIEIGDGVVLSRGVHIVAFDRVTLGDGVMVGEYSSLRDANHRSSDTRLRDSGHDSAPIRIEPNVWIGRGVSVLKGVAIGSGAIVGANAVVTRDVAPRSRVAGAPARAIGPCRPSSPGTPQGASV